MCYNLSYLTRKRLDYARRYGTSADIEEIEKDIEKIGHVTGPVYFVNGYVHPDVPVMTNDNQGKIQLFSWGLIPFWVKDPVQAVEISKRTLNARGEDMFEKPSYKHAARSKRCLVIIDGFFEYHWKEGLSYPYFIRMKKDEPFSLGGLWSTWYYKPENMVRNTFSIITTKANELMSYIHNQPKGAVESRMPLIIPEDSEGDWLSAGDTKADIDRVKELIHSYDESEMEAYPVKKLMGRDGVGNSPLAIERYNYPELE